jgi:hypothetical protein
MNDFSLISFAEFKLLFKIFILDFLNFSQKFNIAVTHGKGLFGSIIFNRHNITSTIPLANLPVANTNRIIFRFVIKTKVAKARKGGILTT